MVTIERSYKHLKKTGDKSEYIPPEQEITPYSKMNLRSTVDSMDVLAREWAGVLTIQYESAVKPCDYVMTIRADYLHFYTQDFIDYFSELINSVDCAYIEGCGDNTNDVRMVVIQSNAEDTDSPFFGRADTEEDLKIFDSYNIDLEKPD